MIPHISIATMCVMAGVCWVGRRIAHVSAVTPPFVQWFIMINRESTVQVCATDGRISMTVECAVVVLRDTIRTLIRIAMACVLALTPLDVLPHFI